MTKIPVWYYDEMKFSGVDFSRMEEVAAYDSMHRKLRDYARTTEAIIRRLSLDSGSTVIDLGCGTGAFALHAAGKCRTIYAVDVSRAMLDYCKKQAEEKGIANIVYCHGGLLTYEHIGEPADAIVCVAVLHHLPDFWKQVALTRCCGMLKPKGQLLLFDIVFPSGTDNLHQAIDAWISSMETMVEARLAEEAVIHVKDEFSTYDWILEGLIQRSGFDISSKEFSNGLQATYVCTKR
ncbi:class I SAM-dependent methyltransferase [Methanoregula sp.]|uniref:class I SAM-dependent methyltransferase n=1 Tax=Methanoregula sp. TaxID=2052170 RepID=UPI00236EA485|nr:class I SAM-dependent methyltransferase [Methanoregula sp.]MDD1686302.1 class I SAM-dependent methyltransferase [Methanoregula sp.]